jgi:hypothetical protein
MATCSITDPFTVKANDFYRAVVDSMEAADKTKGRPAPPSVKARPMTKEEIKRLLDQE